MRRLAAGALISLASSIVAPAATSAETAGSAVPVAAEVGKPAGETANDPGKARLRAIVRREAEDVGLPADVAEAVAEVESGFNVGAIGGVGEIGLMQVLPSTARMLGFRAPAQDLFKPETNAHYGVRYLGEAWRKTGADICATVMKYRAGHGETRYSHRSVAYCARVRELLVARGYPVTGSIPAATFGDPASPMGRGAYGAKGWGAVKRLTTPRMRRMFAEREIMWSRSRY